MKEFVTIGYELSELSPVAAAKAYSDWLDAGRYDFDSQIVIDDMIECGATIGITVDNVYYSGFSSQGDGACFVGAYEFKPDWKDALADFGPGYTQLIELGERLQQAHEKYGELYATVYKINYRYDHENTVAVDVQTNDEYIDILAAQEEMDSILKDFMREIYRRLGEEYTWGQSIECFKGMAECNKWYFTEQGKLL